MTNVVHIGCRYLPGEGRGQLRNVRLINELAAVDGLRLKVVSYDADGSGRKAYGTSGPIAIRDNLHLYYAPGVGSICRRLVDIVGTGEVDVIHAHNPRVALAAMLVAPRVPVVVELHSFNRMSAWKDVLTRAILKRARHVVVLGRGAKDLLVTAADLAPSRVSVVLNGIDQSFFEAPLARTPGNQVRVGYVGSFHRWQGVHDLVDAIRQIPPTLSEVEFHLVGNGPEWEAVRARAEAMEVNSKVLVRPPVAPDLVPQLLADLDVITIPRPSTQATEITVPLKVFEAMAAGAAIVASDVGGLREVLTDGRNCLMYPAGDTSALARAITALVANRQLREELGQRARQDVTRMQSWGDSASQLSAIYSDVLAEGMGE